MLWAGLAAGAAALYYYFQSQPVATPLSVYPSLASMAASPTQKTTAAVAPTVGEFSSVQAANVAAIASQCVGSNVCSPLLGDTQLGL